MDIAGFGDARRTNTEQLAVRDGLYLVLRQAFGSVGLPWSVCSHEDRGDGVFILAPAELPKAVFVDALPQAVVDALCRHNETHLAEEQIRLRMALHAGEVHYDDHGATAAAINLAFRLVDAEQLKTALSESTGALALIVSSWFFDEVVRHSVAAAPATYRPIGVSVKETVTTAWICLPDNPYPPHHFAAPPRHAAAPVPKQLPAQTPFFVGRDSELRRLSALLDTASPAGGAVAITVISGIGGIGKTSLALRWAHHNAGHFPDGQLYVNLRGFDPSHDPMPSAVAVRAFLDALTVDPAVIPLDVDAQAALYRSLTADRRMLVLLDNARDSTQIAPLLPGSPECTVVVTSRHQLPGLVTSHGARVLPLEVFNPSEAKDLLARHLGAARLAAEPAATTALLAHCAGLPLAISILGALATSHPDFPLNALVEALREESARLDALNAGELAADLRAVFSASIRALNAEAAELFGLLGVAPGPDTGVHAAASLAATSPRQVRTVLAQLERAHLVSQYVPGRYRMHDLIRLYAAEKVRQSSPVDTRTAALRRIVDFYLHTAFAAERLLDPYRGPIQLDTPVPGCLPYPLHTEAAALTWFGSERVCVLAAQRVAAQEHWHTIAWQLAWTLDTFHWRCGEVYDHLATWRLGLTAAERLADPNVQAMAHRNLGNTCYRAGIYTEALAHLGEALTWAEQTGDNFAQAHTHRRLASLWTLQGDHYEALVHASRTLNLVQGTGKPVWEAQAHVMVGWCHARLGRDQRARDCCEDALDVFRRYDFPEGEADTLECLGYIALRNGQHIEALNHYHDVLTLRRAMGDTYQEADALAGLAQAYYALGHVSTARATNEQALQIYMAQHRTAEAERIQQQLTVIEAVQPDKA